MYDFRKHPGRQQVCATLGSIHLQHPAHAPRNVHCLFCFVRVDYPKPPRKATALVLSLQLVGWRLGRLLKVSGLHTNVYDSHLCSLEIFEGAGRNKHQLQNILFIQLCYPVLEQSHIFTSASTKFFSARYTNKQGRGRKRLSGGPTSLISCLLSIPYKRFPFVEDRKRGQNEAPTRPEKTPHA